MSKCTNCHSCLAILDTGDAVYNHCSLCGKYYDVRTGKEINLMESVYIIKINDITFAISGRLFKDVRELERYITESISLDNYEITQVPVRISKKDLLDRIISWVYNEDKV